MIRIVDDLERFLDPEWDFHRFSWDRLRVIRNAAYNLWANAGIDGVADARIDETLDRILIAAIELETPTRWPASCILLDENGQPVPGQNNPCVELAVS